MTSQARNWNILCWNIRGINSPHKWRSLREKIEESMCAVICIQETKREIFDHSYLKNFCPKRYDKFACSSSIGACGGILVIWNSSVFSGQLVHQLPFALTLEFTSTHSLEKWSMTTVYGPCDGQPRDDFVNWLYNLQILSNANWLVLGDFNFIRSTENRNRAGGNINDIMIFNDVVGHLGLIELPLKGRSFTWSNMQEVPLLEQLDWFFTTTNWTSSYPKFLILW